MVPKQEGMQAYQLLIQELTQYVIDNHNEMKLDQDKKNKAYCDRVDDDGKEKVPKKLLVHCKGGTGRTGVTIALINMFIMIKR